MRKTPQTLLFLGTLVLLMIPAAHAITVAPSRYNVSSIAGDTKEYYFVFTPDNQTPLAFSKIDITGECAPWITLDRVAPFASTNATPINATIRIPRDAYNGWTRCDITFTGDQSKNVIMAVALPVSLNITGGQPRPTPTQTPTTIPTTITTPTPTATPTAPPTPKTTYAPLSGLPEVAALIALLMMRRRS